MLASLQIARAIKRHRGKVTVHVPHHAMSGGTLIALAADEIVMAPDAVLGPVDPQIGEFPAVSILEVVKQKPMAEIDDRTLILADVAKKAIRQTKDAVLELLSGNYPPLPPSRLSKGRLLSICGIQENKVKRYSSL